MYALFARLILFSERKLIQSLLVRLKFAMRVVDFTTKSLCICSIAPHYPCMKYCDNLTIQKVLELEHPGCPRRHIKSTNQMSLICHVIRSFTQHKIDSDFSASSSSKANRFYITSDSPLPPYLSFINFMCLS